jgi:hypothetical protein
MEKSEFEPAPPEREPQVADVVESMRHLMTELAPDADPEDIEYAVETISAASDLEDAMGLAAGMFDMLGIDYDEGLNKLGDILNVEAISPGGDQE